MGRETAFFLRMAPPHFVFLGTRRVLGLCQTPLQARPLLRQADAGHLLMGICTESVLGKHSSPESERKVFQGSLVSVMQHLAVTGAQLRGSRVGPPGEAPTLKLFDVSGCVQHNSCACRRVRSSGFAAVILNIPFVSKKIHPSVMKLPQSCYRSKSPASCDLEGKTGRNVPWGIGGGEGS